MENLNLLDKIIVGRVDPYIYAFTTNTVPNYLKIGDTYRPVQVRLNEWKKYYPELKKEFEEKAKVDEDVFFRDYSIHKFIEEELGKIRLLESDLEKGIYYSNEFFKDTTPAEVEEAILDIKKNYEENTSKYQYYNANNLPIVHHYVSTGMWKLRPNQEEAVKKFKIAVNHGRKNLLMYAVMRFGKSFTSLMCAKEINAKVVVVVSAKADVKEEWKKTVESADNLNSDYVFLSSDELIRNSNIIEETINNKGAVIFLTLQDLQGDIVKEKHKKLFEKNIDLLIIDETHFGARAEKYGQVLRNTNYESDVKDKYSDDFIETDEALKHIKILNAKVRLHLSGTPYRILMGSEFSKEDIISFCQFSDIVKAQNDWDKENILNDNFKEWENPYYGFPQMIRFAFNPSSSAREKLKEYKKNGFTYAFSSLFKPMSIKKDKNGNHKKFINEKEILELFEVIDGSKTDDNLLGFLDYDKIKEGKMCRHIVCVLPYCASCDALEELIKNNHNKFKNLNEYEIINISGVENTNLYKTTTDVKQKINECEKSNIKTITLTVNRMLTGSTVQEWDTMLYFKDTASPQEYDQSIFRLQNQYIKEYVDDNGDVIKYNMKPQTLLVDFDPERMFVLQETKSLIYNVNIEEAGNSLLKERLANELEISPIITINKDKLMKITPENIMSAVSNYSHDRGVLEETNEIPVDLSLLQYEEIRKVIEKQGEFGSKQGLFIENAEGEGEEMEIPEPQEIEHPDYRADNDDFDDKANNIDNSAPNKTLDPIKQFRTYYARILFYAFLTNDKVISLDEIINNIDNEDNSRISYNLGLDKNILMLIKEYINPFILSQLDYKIQNINNLSNDNSLEPIDRAVISINKFSKLSESEIITPQNVCKKIYETIGVDNIVKIINNNGKILDIASKEGEFLLALNSLIKDVNMKKMKNSFYSIPTSKTAYEFTRKIYEILNFNINNIAYKFCSYGLIKFNDKIDELKKLIFQKKDFFSIELEENLFTEEECTNMKFDIIVGNPPYQEQSKNTSDMPIYNEFMDIAYKLSDKVCFITPARFLFNAGKTPKNWNNKMLNDKHFKIVSYYPESSSIFDNVDIKGGIAISYRNASEDYGGIGQYIVHDIMRDIVGKVKESNFKSLSELVYSPESYRFSKKIHEDNPELYHNLSLGHLYDLTSNIFEKIPNVFLENEPFDTESYIKIFGRENNNRVYKWIKKDYIDKHDNLDKYKVFLAKANGTGIFGEILSEPIISNPNIGHTQTFISIGNFETLYEAKSLSKYLKTKFLRALLGTLKVTQDNKKSVWSNIPIQNFSKLSDIDWNKSIHEIDLQLYTKYKLTEAEINFIESKVKEM